MSERPDLEAAFARTLAACDRVLALLDAMNATAARMNDRLDRARRDRGEVVPFPTLPDVPLHQSGFGVMDEPPA
jgi:hypothetical protein